MPRSMKYQLPSQIVSKTDLESQFNALMKKKLSPNTDSAVAVDSVEDNHQELVNLLIADGQVELTNKDSIKMRLLDHISSINNAELLKLLIEHDKPTKAELLKKGIAQTDSNVLRYYLEEGDIEQLHYGETTIQQALIQLAKTLPNLPIIGIIVDRDFSESAILKIKEEGMLPLLLNFDDMPFTDQRSLSQELESVKRECTKVLRNIPEYLLSHEGENILIVKKHAASFAKLVDGLWLPGGTDIAPFFYHPQIQKIGRYNFDVIRTLFELALIEQQQNHPYFPIVGVCRGHQMINIAKGGTLIHHVSKQYGIQQLTPKIQSGILGESLSSNINVSVMHHQALDKLGEGIEVIASYQGIVKAAQGINPSQPLLLVQFHPEENDDTENSIIIHHMSTIFKAAKKQISYIPDTYHPLKIMTYEKEVKNPICLSREPSSSNTHFQKKFESDSQSPNPLSSTIIINMLLSIIAIYTIRKISHCFSKLPDKKQNSQLENPPFFGVSPQLTTLFFNAKKTKFPENNANAPQMSQSY